MDNEQIHSEVFEYSSDSIYIFNVTADGRFMVEAVNPAMERATGYSEAQIRGKYIEDQASERVLQQGSTAPSKTTCTASRPMPNK